MSAGLDGALFALSPTRQQTAERLLACNETTAAVGLTLTPQQALALADTHARALRATGRLEFGESAARRLILAFCDSPYLTRDNYEATLHELIDLFYTFKNETADRLSDEELIACMKDAFDGACQGSTVLLAGDRLPALAKRLNERYASPELGAEVMTDD